MASNGWKTLKLKQSVLKTFWLLGLNLKEGYLN